MLSGRSRRLPPRQLARWQMLSPPGCAYGRDHASAASPALGSAPASSSPSRAASTDPIPSPASVAVTHDSGAAATVFTPARAATSVATHIGMPSSLNAASTALLPVARARRWLDRCLRLRRRIDGFSSHESSGDTPQLRSSERERRRGSTAERRAHRHMRMQSTHTREGEQENNQSC